MLARAHVAAPLVNVGPRSVRSSSTGVHGRARAPSAAVSPQFELRVTIRLTRIVGSSLDGHCCASSQVGRNAGTRPCRGSAHTPRAECSPRREILRLPSTVGMMPPVTHRTLGKSLIVAAATFTLALSAVASTSAAATRSTLPTMIRATMLTDPTGASYPTPLPYGTPVTREKSRMVTPATFVENVGWAVEWDGPAGNIGQYPIRRNDHGTRWKIAGPYLAITGAAGANVNSITVFTSRIVIAYSKGANVLDVTWDAGRHWFKAWMPGNIISVSSPSTPNGSSGTRGSPASMWVHVRSLGHPTSVYYYSSHTSGRIWRLDRARH